MGVLIPRPVRRVTAELLDSSSADLAELRGNLRDIARFNRWFGGTAAVLKAVEALAGAGDGLQILDAGCGGGDIARAIVRRARRRRRTVRITAVDRHGQVLETAAAWSRNYPEIEFLRADILDLPFSPASFDIAFCALTLHHLTAAGAARLLRKLDEVTRRGYVVTDLERSRAGYWAAWLATRLLSRNRMTRHDGPASVLRSWSPAEFRSLGLPCRRRRFFRLAATIAK